MKEIVLDTETTGISVKEGHRIVEIGCIELDNLIPTKNKFHCYLNPERKVSEKALQVHGYTNEFLAKQSFDKLKLRIKDNDSINVITSIMDDEQDHADNSIETLDDIMADEYKHWGYAQQYYEKKYPESKLKKAFYREKIKNKLRLAYLKNFKVLNKIFDPIIIFLILIFGNLVRLIKLNEPSRSEIVLNDLNPSSII